MPTFSQSMKRNALTRIPRRCKLWRGFSTTNSPYTVEWQNTLALKRDLKTLTKKNLSVHCVGHRNPIPNRDRSRGWCILPSRRIVIRSYFPILVYGAFQVHAECEDQSRRRRPNKSERRPTLRLCGSILSPADFRFLNDRANAFSTAAKYRMVRCIRGAMRDQPILMGLIRLGTSNRSRFHCHSRKAFMEIEE
ncbi:hypothetical protein BDV39DRAFT_42182 [Aspergillus sergii]|uniref:Uncharacterized protein n=1 Tax=Aspergillus sergii TaxID=1034303 RepID=A0A5N6XE22_9EURO|nr:hypothetical protein BDV39DRAFT_42182 [Aspergillus sergii]